MAQGEHLMVSPPLSPATYLVVNDPFSSNKDSNLSTLSRAKLDMAFIRILSEQKTPLAQIQSMLKMSPTEKIAMIQSYGEKEKGNVTGEGGESGGEMHRSPSMPDLAVLDETFSSLLTSLGISAEYQSMFNKLPANKKWVLVSQHKNSISKMQAQQPQQEGSSPMYFVKLFELSMTSLEHLLALRAALLSQSPDWASEFVNHGGVSLVCVFINEKIKSPEQVAKTDCELLHVLVDILKHLIGSSQGIEAAVKCKVVPSSLILLFTSPDISIKTKIVEIFISICTFSHKGYAQVISAFKLLKDAINEDQRFETLVHSLSYSDATPSYLECTMKLINKLTSIPEDAASRSRIRDEFIQLGILNITVAKSFPQPVLSELELFQDMKAADEKTASSQTEKPIPLNETDPTKIFHFLQTSTTNTPYYQHFLHTMQSLLELTSDVEHGPKIWETVDSLTFQYKQMINRQEVPEETMILSPRSSGNLETNIKNKYTNHIDHMGKLLHSTVQQVITLENQLTQSRKEQNTIQATKSSLAQQLAETSQNLEDAKKESEKIKQALTGEKSSEELILLTQENEQLARQLRELRETMQERESVKTKEADTGYSILKHKYFASICLAIKLDFARQNKYSNVQVDDLWEKAEEMGLPVDQFAKFITAEFQFHVL